MNLAENNLLMKFGTGRKAREIQSIINLVDLVHQWIGKMNVLQWMMDYQMQ